MQQRVNSKYFSGQGPQINSTYGGTSTQNKSMNETCFMPYNSKDFKNIILDSPTNATSGVDKLRKTTYSNIRPQTAVSKEVSRKRKVAERSKHLKNSNEFSNINSQEMLPANEANMSQEMNEQIAKIQNLKNIYEEPKPNPNPLIKKIFNTWKKGRMVARYSLYLINNIGRNIG